MTAKCKRHPMCDCNRCQGAFRPGYFRSAVHYETWRALAGNVRCTCTFDDYDRRLDPHADCPVHGEVCVACTDEGEPMLKARCPMHGEEKLVAKPPKVQGNFGAGPHSGVHYKNQFCDREPACVPVAEPGTPPEGPAGASSARAAAAMIDDAHRPDGLIVEGPNTVSHHANYRPPPDHYSTGAGIDPWAVWDAFDLDRYTANAVKYLLRAGKKDIAPRLDDLKKAKDYVLKAIEVEEAKSGNTTD